MPPRQQRCSVPGQRQMPSRLPLQVMLLLESAVYPRGAASSKSTALDPGAKNTLTLQIKSPTLSKTRWPRPLSSTAEHAPRSRYARTKPKLGVWTWTNPPGLAPDHGKKKPTNKRSKSAQGLIRAKRPGGIIVPIDSVAASRPQGRNSECEYGRSSHGAQARLESQALRTLQPFFSV